MELLLIQYLSFLNFLFSFSASHLSVSLYMCRGPEERGATAPSAALIEEGAGRRARARALPPVRCISSRRRQRRRSSRAAHARALGHAKARAEMGASEGRGGEVFTKEARATAEAGARATTKLLEDIVVQILFWTLTRWYLHNDLEV